MHGDSRLRTGRQCWERCGRELSPALSPSGSIERFDVTEHEAHGAGDAVEGSGSKGRAGSSPLPHEIAPPGALGRLRSGKSPGDPDRCSTISVSVEF